jgi:hypothetical protein
MSERNTFEQRHRADLSSAGRGRLGILVFPGISRAELQQHALRADAHYSADLEQLQAMVSTCSSAHSAPFSASRRSASISE